MKQTHEYSRLVSVCIASIGRPSLLQTIRGVCACVRPAGLALEIVVADDSLTGEAVALLLCNVERAGVRDVRIVMSAAQNISVARNTCMAHAKGDFIVFVDDDEVPDVNWLRNLVQLADSSGADAVQGSVVGIYPGDSPGWANKLRPFDKTYGRTGTRIEVGSTCNLLLRRSSLVMRSLKFNSRFGKSGGEDTDICYRLTSGGGVIVCSPAAVVYEHVPLERLGCRHLVLRYARGGHTYASVVLSRQGRLRRTAEIGKAFVLTAAYSLLATVSLVLPAASMRFTLRLSGNVGKLIFFLGLPAWSLY